MDRHKKLLWLGVIAIAFGLSLPSFAQVYKYQDSQGRWHFTDTPPHGIETELIQEKKAERIHEKGTEDSLASRDIATDLQNKYSPKSAVERASLAVVAIQTRLAAGSGFFVSAHGHILTNKHVVKPAETREWKELQEAVELRRKEYKTAKNNLAASTARLDKIATELENYRRAIDNAPSGYGRNVAEAEYRYFKTEYDRYRADFDQAKKNFKKSQRAFEKARSEFNWETSAAILERQFKIILKDNTELTARLVSESAANDIALIKIDGYTTPVSQSWQCQ